MVRWSEWGPPHRPSSSLPRTHSADVRPAASVHSPSVPSICLYLIHVHVVVKSKSGNKALKRCAEWDAAVQAVQVAVWSARVMNDVPRKA